MILCGGVGERLWPLSRPGRPKPFLPLLGTRSTFQAALLRARALAGGQIIVSAAARDEALVREQLAAVDMDALIILEPESRDTAPAIAAAAAWTAQEDPDAVLVVLPADHHIPDTDAFRDAVEVAVVAARGGAIVTLGLRPDRPSTALGYIRPAQGREPVRPIAEFLEKPDAARAAALVAEGALWNGGVFVARAQVLQDEIARHAAEVASAVEAALREVQTEAGAVRLGASYGRAPRIAFDRAVMERTDRGAVLPVEWAWSDLGAWDAVLAASEQDVHGNSLTSGVQAPGASQVLVRAADGVDVRVVGARRLVVVAEPDAVLVCGLEAAQDVREARAATALASVRAAPGVEVAVVGANVAVVAASQAVLVRAPEPVLRPRRTPFGSFEEAAEWFGVWLDAAALPLWATQGVDAATGGFREALTWDGSVHDVRRRARVQARQAFVFASADADGITGPWSMLARDGFGWFRRQGRRADGLYATAFSVEGQVTDPEPRLYEHAFVLLALCALSRSDGDAAGEAASIAERLRTQFQHPEGGYREAGPQPFQANAHMHLLEAALAWDSAGAPGWARALADEVATLSLRRFIDPATGAVREFFDAGWSAVDGEAGLIEPGHQFEWAWLLHQWSNARGDADAADAARRLFAAGRKGWDAGRGVVQNAVWPDLSVRDGGARLWAQTEHLKAAVLLGEQGAALEAANGLLAFLDTPQPGCWRERMAADGAFLEEPSPATSLYHLYGAIRELRRAAAKPW
ncbi:MAG: AGE family epimerase/isomerase [Phenylobacterium sp.]|uniref:AGE family epimerase/isomerase n=1 Tax=Phenylobacterium sp. TaxID=1871053 RepID=UPI001A5EA90E|nr:AGE family epimerase/isomerase [Phenylobacterium sp.]MBL8772695.1 AGE family epimerase/isomerase [Phenylobacterium sp.]